MTNMITRKEVDKLAELAQLDLREDERAEFGEKMNQVLDYIDQIQAVKAVATENNPANLNLMREDKITNEPGQYTADIVREMPQSEDGFLKIHKILGDNE